MNRRRFITGLAGILIAEQAPLYVRAGLMRIKPISPAHTIVYWIDGVMHVKFLLHDANPVQYAYDRANALRAGGRTIYLENLAVWEKRILTPQEIDEFAGFFSENLAGMRFK